MATYGKKLLDNNNNVILPKTRSNLVYMDNNETVEDTINKIISGTTVVAKATYATSAGSAVDQTARNNASAAQTTANNAMPKSGGAFTGSASAVSTNRSGATLRNIEVKNSSDSFVSTNSIIFYRQ